MESGDWRERWKSSLKLHESENAWKPPSKVEGTAEDNIETLKLYRKVRGILNKLTPQKFDTLVEQVKNLEITTEEELNGVTDLIFEKAIDEPNFSALYANMCKRLALIKVPLNGQKGQIIFRNLLLTKCQKEFEQGRCDKLKREERVKAIEVAEPENKKGLQLKMEKEDKKMYMRQLGNIRFIGELFKLNMLIELIMHECIKELLTQGDEESIECLCILLKTTGKELDNGKINKGAQDANPMDQYFAQMQKIVDRRLTSSRVRFMLQDVIDLKKNNWVPRRDENNPKTIDQIHEEEGWQQETREVLQVFQNMPYFKRIPDDRRKTSDLLNDSDFPPDLERLSLDFSNLLNNETLSDVKLRCGNCVTLAHRSVLAARSEVFAAMFINKMSESQTGTVDVEDLEEGVFDFFLQYLYSGKIAGVPDDDLPDLYEAADRYAMRSLKNACRLRMMGRLNAQNCVRFLTVADAHSDAGLKREVVSYICGHDSIFVSDVWREFSEEPSKLVMEVYQTFFQSKMKK